MWGKYLKRKSYCKGASIAAINKSREAVKNDNRLHSERGMKHFERESERDSDHATVIKVLGCL